MLVSTAWETCRTSRDKTEFRFHVKSMPGLFTIDINVSHSELFGAETVAVGEVSEPRHGVTTG